MPPADCEDAEPMTAQEEDDGAAAAAPDARDPPGQQQTPAGAPAPIEALPPGGGTCATDGDARQPTVAELRTSLAVRAADGPPKNARLAVRRGSLLFGAAMHSGSNPSLGDYCIGVVTSVPSSLDDNYYMVCLWRDPLSGEPVEVREGVSFGKKRMTTTRFVDLDAKPLPYHYSPADVALLRLGRLKGIFEA